MKRFKALVVVCALSVLLGASTNAWASILWSYDWTPGTTNVISDSGSNQIFFSNQAKLTASNSSDIVATNITVNNPVTGSSDTFTHQNYSLKMLLTDVASGQSTTLLFSGNLTGTITPHSSNILNAFDPLHTMAEVDLGDNHYKVTIGPYTPPGPAGSNPGSIGAHVDVRSNGGQEPPPNDVPEPSTMVLSMLGLAGIGVGAWKKYKLARA